jgi:hypothetical protein
MGPDNNAEFSKEMSGFGFSPSNSQFGNGSNSKKISERILKSKVKFKLYSPNPI